MVVWMVVHFLTTFWAEYSSLDGRSIVNYQLLTLWWKLCYTQPENTLMWTQAATGPLLPQRLAPI